MGEGNKSALMRPQSCLSISAQSRWDEFKEGPMARHWRKPHRSTFQFNRLSYRRSESRCWLARSCFYPGIFIFELFAGAAPEAGTHSLRLHCLNDSRFRRYVSPPCRPHAHPDERQFEFVYFDRGGADMLAGDLGGNPRLGQNFRDRHQAFRLADVITAFR